MEVKSIDWRRIELNKPLNFETFFRKSGKNSLTEENKMIKIRTHRHSRQVLTWRAASLLMIAAMLLSLGTGLVPSNSAIAKTASLDPAPVDPYVYIALEQKGTAQVMVMLKEQADLSGADQLKTKAEKGQYVYDQLTEVAARTQGALKNFLDTKSASYRSYWIQNMFIVTADVKLVQELALQPGVARLELYSQPYPDRVGHDLGSEYGSEYGPILSLNEQTYSGREIAGFGREFGPFTAGTEAVEWNIQRVNADDVWGLGINGAGAVIGDLDTGVQWNHPALINSYRGWNGMTADHNYNWYDGGYTTVPTDYDTHGTHTMGTIVGNDGGSNQIGMAPGAKWIACPGIGSPYVGPFECFQFFMAPTDLYGNSPNPALAPHVISNSWSSAGTDFHPSIQALYAAGIFFSKSAGNNGPSCSTITNPGQWSEVTAAAAFAQGDTISSFSSRGPVYISLDATMKPDIAAPGSNVRSSLPVDSYGLMSGTSMACPHVTGAVALLVSANPELAGRIDVLQMILKLAAEPKISTQCQPFVDHPNDVWGWGILDALAAVQMAQAMTFGDLEGVVYDDAAKATVADAQLYFEDTTTNWQLTEMSGPDGSYSKSLPAGTYDVMAYKYGYLMTTVPDVVITEGDTTTQDITLTTAPVWTVSGSVTEEQTGDPLAANVEFVDTPVTSNTDASSGAYTADVSEGEWWMHVTSLGHTTINRKVTVDQDLTEDFSMAAIYNYYMKSTQDGACGPTFTWKDASGGTQRNLDDDAFVVVALPSGRNFTFYGNTYTSLYVGSNGIVTFGTGDSKWSGTIPDPATPNNGIYAFSTDLNPALGTQGKIYTAYLEDRYFVIEWYQVQHYPSGDPETFEIILDLDTGKVTIQFLVVNNPTDVVVGVENASGTEATQYAYSDPGLIAAGKAVDFYSIFSTPPPTGGPGELVGNVFDFLTEEPLVGASVSAVAFTTGEVFSYTTDATGAFTDTLCADWYDLTVTAEDYKPAEVRTNVFDSGHTVQDIPMKTDATIGVEPPELEASLQPDETYESPLSISNSGSVDLTFDLVITPTVDWLSVDPISGTVLPGGSKEVTATFDSAGMEMGIYTTTIEISSNDPDTPLVVVPTTLEVYSSCDPVSNADFGWQPETPMDGEVITFTSTASGTQPILYAWDFDDGAGGMGDVVTHTYEEAGSYTVVMTATNCDEIPVVVTHTVVVESSCEPVNGVDFTWSPEKPIVGELVAFNGTALGTEPFAFEWTFSDGFTATTAIAEHAFTEAGTYTVTLTVSNCAGASDTVSYTITVVPMQVFLPIVWKN
jgi:PKD repeat protein